MNSSYVVYAGHNSILAMRLSRFFRNVGYRFIMVAADGGQAVEAVRILKPLIIFISSALEGLISAQETAARIERVHHVPTVLVTDCDEAGDIQNQLITCRKDAGNMLSEMCMNAQAMCAFVTPGDMEGEKIEHEDICKEEKTRNTEIILNTIRKEELS